MSNTYDAYFLFLEWSMDGEDLNMTQNGYIFQA